MSNYLVKMPPLHILKQLNYALHQISFRNVLVTFHVIHFFLLSLVDGNVAALFFSPEHEFRFMLVNQIQRDMNRYDFSPLLSASSLFIDVVAPIILKPVPR